MICLHLCVGGAPNYYPNSFSGPADDVKKFGAKPSDKVCIQVHFPNQDTNLNSEVSFTFQLCPCNGR